MTGTQADPKRSFIGREPERLSLEERRALLGRWIALPIYSPQSLPLRRIEAVADSPADCIRQLRERGLSPANFEFNIWRTV